MTTPHILGLDALKGKFLDSLDKRIGAMEKASDDLSEIGSGGGRDALEVLRFETHKLRGAGATFGFPLLSRISGLLEDHLLTSRPDPEEIVRFISQLRRAADNRGGNEKN